jgi:alkylation response protein AidB-like acyl-CoA dehydrogenase
LEKGKNKDMVIAATTVDVSDRAEFESIRESVGALIGKGGDLQRIRKLRFTEIGFERTALELMGDMGWVALTVPEDKGGIGLGLGELCVVCQELGAGLVPEPLIQANMSASLLAHCGAQSLLSEVIAGKHLVLTAWQEKADTLDVPGRVDARRYYIPLARGADGFLFPVRRDGRLDLVYCRRDAVSLQAISTQDGGHYGNLQVDLNFGEVIGTDIEQVIAVSLDRATLATAAYLVGAMEVAFSRTLEYLKNRKQFGRTIGSFQVVQHRCVDLKARAALCRASMESAARVWDAGAERQLRQSAVSRAKASASDGAMFITREAIQLHGAIGFTDEYDVGLYLRKAIVLAGQFGSARLHRQRFLALSASIEAA